MSYIKTVWSNYVEPALNAMNMNKLEQGVYENSVAIEEVISGDQPVGLATLAEGLAPGAVMPTNVGPIGSIQLWAGLQVPYGWDICDGTAVNKESDYSSLFAIIGTTFGPGNGTTTFNLPDMRNLVVKGLDLVGTDDIEPRTLGSVQEGSVGNHQHNLFSSQSGAGLYAPVTERLTNVAVHNVSGETTKTYTMVSSVENQMIPSVGVSSQPITPTGDSMPAITNVKNIALHYIIRSY